LGTDFGKRQVFINKRVKNIKEMEINLKYPANGGGCREIFLRTGKNFRFGLERGGEVCGRS